MRSLLTYLVLVLIIFFNSCKTNSKDFTTKELKKDIEYVFDKIEKIHVNPYFKFSKEYVDSCKNEMLQTVFPMDTVEFNSWIEPRVNFLFDAHTGITNFYQERDDKPKSINNQIIHFTYNDINASLDTLFINTLYNTLKKHKTGKYQLISIGGQNIDKILKYTINSTESDLHKPYRYLIAENLSNDIAYHVEDDSLIPVEIIANNTIVNDTVYFTDKENYYSDIYINNIRSKNDFQIWSDEKIALLNLRNFESSYIDFKTYANFIDTFFDSISHQNIDYLFINLNDNDGGDSFYGMYLLNHICDKHEEITIEKLYIKKSKEFMTYKFEYLKNNLNLTDSSDLANLWRTIENIDYDTLREIKWTIKPKPNIFNGQVIILQSKQTFSAPITFCATSKFYNFATLVGEETGGLTQTYIDKVFAHMPNTKIVFNSSSKYNEYVGSQKFHGVIPDVYYDFENIKQIEDRYYLKKSTLKEIINLIQ